MHRLAANNEMLSIKRNASKKCWACRIDWKGFSESEFANLVLINCYYVWGVHLTFLPPLKIDMFLKGCLLYTICFKLILFNYKLFIEVTKTLF